MKRQKKKYSRPQRPFDKIRIDEENVLRERYGLKNKKEIWKADAAISRIRNLAKQLITASEKDKKIFVERLQKKGFNIESIANALSLNKEDWLKRRLQTVLVSKKLTTTPKQARQMITHKHVSIGNQIVNIPSYQVELEEEPMVNLDIVLKVVQKPKSKEQEIKEDILEKEDKVKEVKKDLVEAEKEEKVKEKEIVEKVVEKVEEKKESVGEAEKEIAKKITKEEDIVEEIKEKLEEAKEEKAEEGEK